MNQPFGIGAFFLDQILNEIPTDQQLLAQKDVLGQFDILESGMIVHISRLSHILGKEEFEKVGLTEENTPPIMIDFIKRMRSLSENPVKTDRIYTKKWWPWFINICLNPMAFGFAFNPPLKIIEAPIFSTGVCSVCKKHIKNGLNSNGVCFGYCELPVSSI